MISCYKVLPWVIFLGSCACLISPEALQVDLTIYYENDLLGKLLAVPPRRRLFAIRQSAHSCRCIQQLTRANSHC